MSTQPEVMKCPMCHNPKIACKCKPGGGGKAGGGSGGDELPRTPDNSDKSQLSKPADLQELVFSKDTDTLAHAEGLDSCDKIYLARAELTAIKKLFDDEFQKYAEEQELSPEALKAKGYGAEIKDGILTIRAPKEFGDKFLNQLASKNMIEKTPIAAQEFQKLREQAQNPQNTTAFRSPLSPPKPGETPRCTPDKNK